MSENLSITEKPIDNKKLSPNWLTFTFLGGILLPLITLVIEFTTHICAKNFFDPIPSLWHVLVVGFVPFGKWLNFVVIAAK